MIEAPVEDLHRLAAAGDQVAWKEIVRRYDRLVWGTARAQGLSRDDAAEVAQTTWLRLVENFDRIRNPEKLGGWLAQTARREAWLVSRRGGRERPTDELDLFEAPTDDEIASLALGDRDAALWHAFALLSDRCKKLLRELVSADEPTYKEISRRLGWPIGSIGPTRERCLEVLRVKLDRAELKA